MRVTSQTIIISGSVNLVRWLFTQVYLKRYDFRTARTHTHHTDTQAVRRTYILCKEINGCTFRWHFSWRTHRKNFFCVPNPDSRCAGRTHNVKVICVHLTCVASGSFAFIETQENQPKEYSSLRDPRQVRRATL